MFGKNRLYVLDHPSEGKWPAVFIGEKLNEVERAAFGPEKYHSFAYLQYNRHGPRDYRLSRAFVKDGNFTKNGRNVKIKNRCDVFYTSGEREYSKMSFTEYWSARSMLVLQHWARQMGVLA
ncbi:hypothetical protein KW805_03320 [Candidatus Pacearchaeota archaeon]|nr:hypothetical protein [Candidatus Pacearchaeota archaeon]